MNEKMKESLERVVEQAGAVINSICGLIHECYVLKRDYFFNDEIEDTIKELVETHSDICQIFYKIQGECEDVLDA
jgi:hypothetical protein